MPNLSSIDLEISATLTSSITCCGAPTDSILTIRGLMPVKLAPVEPRT